LAQIQKWRGYKPSSVLAAIYLSPISQTGSSEGQNIRLTIPSCYELGLHSRARCRARWWALTPPFHHRRSADMGILGRFLAKNRLNLAIPRL